MIDYTNREVLYTVDGTQDIEKAFEDIKGILGK